MDALKDLRCRAKDQNSHEWVYGYPFFSVDCCHGVWQMHIPAANPDESSKAVFIEEETISRFSGYFDVAGTEIYHGDICQCNDNREDLVLIKFGTFGVVDFDAGAVVDEVNGWYSQPLITDDPLSTCAPFNVPVQINNVLINYVNLKVIGNQWDNPELVRLPEETL